MESSWKNTQFTVHLKNNEKSKLLKPSAVSVHCQANLSVALVEAEMQICPAAIVSAQHYKTVGCTSSNFCMCATIHIHLNQGATNKMNETTRKTVQLASLRSNVCYYFVIKMQKWPAGEFKAKIN